MAACSFLRGRTLPSRVRRLRRRPVNKHTAKQFFERRLPCSHLHLQEVLGRLRRSFRRGRAPPSPGPAPAPPSPDLAAPPRTSLRGLWSPVAAASGVQADGAQPLDLAATRSRALQQHPPYAGVYL